jgi:hypothetical protein
MVKIEITFEEVGNILKINPRIIGGVCDDDAPTLWERIYVTAYKKQIESLGEKTPAQIKKVADAKRKNSIAPPPDIPR